MTQGARPLLATRHHDEAASRAQALLTRSEGELAGECAYLSVLQTKQAIGLHRIRMGALLCALEASDAWRGKTGGQTFRRFMEEEGIEPKAAYQYMEVAKKFVLDLGCAEHQLAQLATASMRVLVEAAKIATKENVDQIIDILVYLPRPEAKEAMLALAASQQNPEPTDEPQNVIKLRASKPVAKIMNQFDDLTQEQRAELIGRLVGHRNRPGAARRP